MIVQQYQTAINSWLIQVWQIFWALTKVMLPMLLLVRIIELMGWVESIAYYIEPVMVWMGLPGEMGLVWVTTMLSSIYTGMAVFYQMGGIEQLSVAQVSVLASVMLIAHGLPVELAITKATGVSVCFTLILRIGGALLLGVLLHNTYEYGQWLQTPINTQWQPTPGDNSWSYWLTLQAQTLLAALVIIAGLTLFIRLLRYLGIEKLIHYLLTPLLRTLGIGKKACNIMVVGLTLGIAFGGGLLIQEAKSGNLDKRDIFITMAFLSLSHSLIEDTLLLALLGADFSAILWARLVFSFIVIAILARALTMLNDKHWDLLIRKA